MTIPAAYTIAIDTAARVSAERQAQLARRIAVLDSQRVVAAPAALGSAVRAARRLRKLTQAELAARAGLGVRMVNELECGRRPHLSLTAALTIAHAVGLELAVRQRETP